VQPPDSLAAATDFRILGLSEASLTALAELGYAAPTPIQRQAIPPLLAGADLIGKARTGSGKTAAFAIPLLERIDADERRLQALVLCPTRDLCAQVAGEIRKLGRRRPNLRVLTVAGGQPLKPQAQALARGAQVVVATPGRLLDHLERGGLAPRSLRLLVLDEADRMLDMGFHDDMARILAALPVARQTALFSATFDDAVRALSERYLRKPVWVEALDAPAAIEQRRVAVTEQDRPAALRAVLADCPPGPVMVFCNTRQTVDEVERDLRRAGLAVDRLHGDLEQPQRELALAKLRNGSTEVLVATDLAARGLDIAGLAAVINYEPPRTPALYLHRIGRTGRAGERGLAVTLHTAEDAARLAEFERCTGGAVVPLALTGASSPPRPRRLRTLCIGAGRKDKLRPGDILGALTGAAGLSAAQVGLIEVTERVSYVAVAAEVAQRALVRLRQGGIKGRRFRIDLS